MKRNLPVVKSISGTALFAYCLFALSLAILIGAAYFALNIQVLRGWTLTLPNGDIHAGDTIVVASRYTKLRQVTGTSTRSIECQSNGNVFISYPLNKVAANRAPGKTGTGVVVSIPTQMQGIQGLPDRCHICIYLTYPVLPFRNVPYFQCTKTFELLPKAVADAVVVSQSPTQSTPIQSGSAPHVVSSGNQSSAISSPQSTPTSTPAQSNTPPQPQTAQNKPQASILSRIIDALKL